jgi:hypothetical protein
MPRPNGQAMKRYRYLCFTETAVRAIVSNAEIKPQNEGQIAWLNRECGGVVLLAIKVQNKPA